MTSTSPEMPARNHLGLFMRQLIRKPGRIVALAPSSSQLSRKMVQELGPETGAVIELGAGTGNITDHIVGRGVPPERLAMFELDGAFCSLLSRHYPRAQVMQISAERCEDAPLENVGAVVSGLPLLSMPTEVQRRIVGGAFRKMRPGGIFVQFTYGFRPPINRPVREELGLKWTASAKVYWNLPPARVYTFRQGALQEMRQAA